MVDRKEYFRQWHLENREKRLLAAKNNYINKKQDYVDRRNKWYKDNKEKKALYSKNLYENNKQVRLEQIKEWKKNNPHVVYTKNARRRAAKIKATPICLSKSDRLQIKEIYKKALDLTKETGVKYHVDHIIPLKSKTVCGLHVPWNLQILEASENIKKSNKVPE